MLLNVIKYVSINQPNMSRVVNSTFISALDGAMPLKVNQSHYRPEVPRGFPEVKFPILHDKGTGWW